MRKVFRWIGIVLGALLGIILVAITALYTIGNARLNKTYDFPPSNIVIPTDAASIEYGRHRAESLCEGCHGNDLSGVENWLDGGPIGTVDSANLTSGEGGAGREYTSDEDYVRALRHGIDPEGKPLFMPAILATSQLSDQDLGAIIAYLKTVPAVDHKTNGQNFKALGKILLAAGKLPQLPVERVSHEIHVTAPEAAVTVEYGEYLVNTNDCRSCHGPNLNGGPFPDPTKTRISPNLTPGGELAFWTEAEFIHTMRSGTTPGGHELDPDYMPWKRFSLLYDDELRAVWLYLESLAKLKQYAE